MVSRGTLRLDTRARAALIALVLVVVSCGFVPTQSAPSKTIVVWVDTPAIGASIRQRVDRFTQDHPNLAVKVFDQAGKIQNGDVSIAIEALANTDLAPDVVALTATDFRLMSNRSDLMNLTPYLIENSGFQVDDFFPTVLDSFRDRGKQYAIPSELVPWVIFYNKQLFDAAKVTAPAPNWTLGQFVSAAQQVTQLSRDKQEVVGFVTDPTVALLPFASTFGVTPQDAIDDPDARWLTDKRTIDAIQWFVDLGLREKIMPVDPGNRTTGYWYAGRAAMIGMYLDQRNVTPQFFERDQVLTPTVTGTGTPPPAWKFQWGAATIPTGETRSSTYYVSGYGIPQFSPNPDESWLLIDYLTSTLPERSGRGYVPSRESLAYSKAFADLYPEDGRQAYLDSIEYGHRVPAWPASANPNADDVRGMLDGSVYPSTGLQALRDRVQPILLDLAKRPAVPYTPTPGSAPQGG